MSEQRLSSLLKWAGGKEQELKYIRPLLPATIERYYEPFVGGGAVFFAIEAREKLINDRSSELMQFYAMVARQDADFLRVLEECISTWQRLSELVDTHASALLSLYLNWARGREQSAPPKLEAQLEIFWQEQQTFQILCPSFGVAAAAQFGLEVRRNLLSKLRRMRKLEQQKWLLPEKDILANLESAFKSAFYMYLRYLYNHRQRYAFAPGVVSAIFFFVRENAYASMFRYNRLGEFNVPYGGITYNRKNLARKVALLSSPRLQTHLGTTVIENLDFEEFLAKHPPRAGDFLFLDPPYDSEFSTYMRNEFGPRDQERLAEYLLKRCPAKFLLVIKNTPLIQTLYGSRGLQIQAFEKKYLVSFQDRNKRETEHLLIRNY